MITWQDPVALTLATLLVGGALWFRRWLIKRGEGGHCAQCTVGDASSKDEPKPTKPTVIDVSHLRIGRRAKRS